MNIQSKNNKEEFINIFNLYLSKWKLILLSLFFFIGLGYLKIKYSTFKYNAKATIKIQEDENSKKMPEISALQDYGMFSNTFTKVVDEIEIIKSRTIISEVVDELKLNIKFYVSGQIKNQEVFVNPPVNLNFLMADSIIKNINTSFYIKILSESKFDLYQNDKSKLLKFNNSDPPVSYTFGNKISTEYGNLIITPNPGRYGANTGTFIEIKISPYELVVDEYLKEIKISNDQKSNVIKLSLEETTPNKAVAILNKIIEKYNIDVIKDKELIVKSTSDFINKRLENVSIELENIDFTAETLQKKNKLTALASQADIYLQSERENESNIIKTSNQLQLINYMSDHLTENDKDSDLLPADIGITDSGLSQITKSHNELVLQRNRILKNSSEKNPTVINLNNQISALKQNLKQSLENIKQTNQITLNNLNKEDDRISSQIYSAPGKQRQFRDITRQQNIKESLYLYLLEKREETAISLGMSSPNAKIIDKAYASSNPVSPKKNIILLASFILGLFVPISIIYLQNLLDNKIHTKKDLIDYLKIPFIGEIPKSNSKDVTVKKVDYSPKAEAFRILRTNIDFMLKNIQDRAKIIFITSTTSKEGKSHTSVNLALSLSYSDKKVLFIETDIRVPKASKYLDVKNKKGLTDFISNNSLKIEDIIIPIKHNPHLNIIPSGTIPPNPAELLMNDRIVELFHGLRLQYDYIIVDTAAIGLVTDTLLISKYADLFIYVVRANYIDKRGLHIAKTMYDEKRLPNMTILLNDVDHKKSYGYGYGYGYGKNPNTIKRWWQKKYSL
ncbi:GumC family protein [Formosa haliotis]|uniref:GumC family protein n=1 Tax=Formosa haliotis TaxID=1555194 RepID=UPI00082425B3|nr:polysaccharide biosynthesis tyrosine autokinase [Formosa haliotis]